MFLSYLAIRCWYSTFAPFLFAGMIFSSMKINVFRLSAHTKHINSISMRIHASSSVTATAVVDTPPQAFDQKLKRMKVYRTIETHKESLCLIKSVDVHDIEGGQ